MSSFGAADDFDELALFAVACRALRSKKLAIVSIPVKLNMSEQEVRCRQAEVERVDAKLIHLPNWEGCSSAKTASSIVAPT